MDIMTQSKIEVCQSLSCLLFGHLAHGGSGCHPSDSGRHNHLSEPGGHGHHSDRAGRAGGR